MNDLLQAGIPFAAAAGVSALLTVGSKAAAVRLGVVARPKDDRWNRRSIPLLGGVAVAGAAFIVFLLSVGAARATVPVLLAGAAMFVLGLVDDFITLKPSTKLLAQIAMASGVVLVGGRLDWFSSQAADSIVTILWVVGVTNAFNLLDNMDGLCAGTAAIAALAFAGAVGVHEAPGIYAIVIAGACAAFLVFNFNPASIFLGDAGSLFLGGSLSVLALFSHTKGGVMSAVAGPAALLLIPIFDTTFVTVSRKLSSRAASTGGRDHTSHRLVAIGFSERQAVLILYGFAALGGATAIAISRAEYREGAIVLALLLIGVALLGVFLARVRVYGEQDFAVLRNKRYTPLLVEVTYRRRLFEVLLDMCMVTIAYYGAYVIRFDNEFDRYYRQFAQSLPLVIAVKLVGLMAAGAYRGVWRYFSPSDVSTYLKGVLIGTIGSVMAVVYLYRFEGYSRGVFIIDAMAFSILLIGSRASFRMMGDWAGRYRSVGERALVYGAGDGGALVVRELRNNPKHGCVPIGFVDDDPVKLGKRMLGLRVIGTLDALPALVAKTKAEVVILSTHKLGPLQRERLERICFETGTPLRQLDFRLQTLVSGATHHT